MNSHLSFYLVNFLWMSSFFHQMIPLTLFLRFSSRQHLYHVKLVPLPSFPNNIIFSYHTLTIYWPYTDHTLTIHWPYTDHIQLPNYLNKYLWFNHFDYFIVISLNLFICHFILSTFSEWVLFLSRNSSLFYFLLFYLFFSELFSLF